jgi:hypothetical protein
MKACPYCGAEHADDVSACPIDGTRLGAPPSHSGFRRPAWLTSLGRLYQSQTPRKRSQIIAVGSFALLVLLVLSTAHYSYNSGVFQISRLPLFKMGLARSDRWRVRSGINYVPRAHLVEFPIYPGYRMSIQGFYLQ